MGCLFFGAGGGGGGGQGVVYLPVSYCFVELPLSQASHGNMNKAACKTVVVRGAMGCFF